MLIFFKKGNIKDIKNYRPICLLSNNIYTLIEQLQKGMDIKWQHGIRVLGFRKAFDKTIHRHLMKSLEASGVESGIHMYMNGSGHTSHIEW